MSIHEQSPLSRPIFEASTNAKPRRSTASLYSFPDMKFRLFEIPEARVIAQTRIPEKSSLGTRFASELTYRVLVNRA